jgi:hypothetical protein
MSIWSLILGVGSIAVLIMGIIKISKSFSDHNKTLMPLIEDDTVFRGAQSYQPLIRKLIKNVFEEEPDNMTEDFISLCRAHFLLGACDYFSQRDNMDDVQFANFFFAMAHTYQPSYFLQEHIEKALEVLKKDNPDASLWMPYVRLGAEAAMKFSNADEESLFLIKITFNRLINDHDNRK